MASGDRATRLVLLGAALVLVGWLGNVTIGVWFLRPGVEVITLVLLAALVMRAAADPDEPLRLPLPPAFVALALSILGGHHRPPAHVGLLRPDHGHRDWLAQLLYVAGVVVVVVGAGIGSAEGARSLTEGPTGDPPAADPAQAQSAGQRPFAHRGASSAVAFGDDLGQDRERGLGRSAPTQVQAHRPPEAIEVGLADARREQTSAAVGLGLARPDRAHVPAPAPERLDDGGFVELDVVRQDRDRVVRAEPDLVGDLVRPADDQAVDLGEALLRGERRPAIDHDGLEAELAREADERTGDLDATDHDESRPDREDLDEQRASAELDGARQAAPECRAGGLDQLRVELRRAERAGQPAVVGDDQLGGRGLTLARLDAARTRRVANRRGVA